MKRTRTTVELVCDRCNKTVDKFAYDTNIAELCENCLHEIVKIAIHRNRYCSVLPPFAGSGGIMFTHDDIIHQRLDSTEKKGTEQWLKNKQEDKNEMQKSARG